jgi:hypothetical protein
MYIPAPGYELVFLREHSRNITDLLFSVFAAYNTC